MDPRIKSGGDELGELKRFHMIGNCSSFASSAGESRWAPEGMTTKARRGSKLLSCPFGAAIFFS